MADFSIIVQDPQTRQLVQDGLLQRAIHDALFPDLLFRMEAEEEIWPGHVGDTIIFTGAGLIPPDAGPLAPGLDAPVVTYPLEQWSSTVQKWARAIDTDMPTSVVSIADFFLRNTHEVGLQGAQSINRVARDRSYNAGLSGSTVCAGAQGPTNTIRVSRLNGLTTARNPNLAAGSPVRFASVSASNPLQVLVTVAGTPTARNVVAFLADNPGDEVGPGTVTLDGAAISVVDRAPLIAVDATFIVRAGGAATDDGINAGQLFALSLIRSAIAHMRLQNVKPQPDSYYHAHLDPISEAQTLSDPELQKLLTALPDYYIYADLALGRMQGTAFIRNNECPLGLNVAGWGGAASPGQNYSLKDPIAGEPNAYDAANADAIKTPLHRAIFYGVGGLREYHLEQEELITDAGVTGRVGKPSITNNSIEVYSDHIQFIIRAPIDRLQEKVSTAYRFIGDFPFRTDAATGDASRYKRCCVVAHGE